VGKYCYVASARRRARRWAPTEGEVRGLIVSPRAQLVKGEMLQLLHMMDDWTDRLAIGGYHWPERSTFEHG